MINLLPTQLKKDYVYARRNHQLIRWVLVFAAIIIGAATITGLGWLYIDRASSDYEKQISISKKQLEDQNYDKIQKEVKDMSNNLQLSVNVLSKQILFSELLQQMGSLMPRDTRLSNLTISQTQGAIDITVIAKDQTSATQVQVNLADPDNKLFSKVDIVSINCDYNSKDGYPCRASLRALFADENPFLFINDKKAKAVR